ncbi:uncharacterized protein [Eurosta solidaginis]|uniref:uncharacterized protein isoform X2 n=1 Tax=Eurosta solidaginis TaxID=178769 RepID=UPI003530D9E6
MFVDSLAFALFVTFFAFALATFCAFYMRGRKRDTTNASISDKAPVVVTSATHTAPRSYPVAQMVPPPTAGYQQQQTMYPPYPTQTQHAPVHMPMPMPMPTAQPPMPAVQPYMAPYPPASAANMNPPSYDAVVAGNAPGAQNNSSSGYEKQAPYNPSYNAY